MWVYGEGPGDLPYGDLVKKNDRERKLRKGEVVHCSLDLADIVKESLCKGPRCDHCVFKCSAAPFKDRLNSGHLSI